MVADEKRKEEHITGVNLKPTPTTSGGRIAYNVGARDVSTADVFAPSNLQRRAA